MTIHMVARGLLTVEQLHAIHTDLCARLQAAGVRLEAIYYCPHHPDDGCACRKPQAGLVVRAAADLGLDLSRSYVVGDQTRDVELARRIAARSVLVTTGPTSLESVASLKAEGIAADTVASSLGDAVDWIVEDVKTRSSSTVNR